MPRDDDRYDEDDRDRPRRRGGVSGGPTALYVLLGLGLVGLVGCGGLILAVVIEVRKAAKEFNAALQNVQQAVQAGPVEVRTTVAELNREYAANPAAADRKFKGKVLLLTGVVEAIDGGEDEGYTVRLAPAPTDPAAMRAECQFFGDEAVAGYNVGQAVTVVGVCEGRQEDDADADEDNPRPRKGRATYVIRLDRCRSPRPDDHAKLDAEAADPKPAAEDVKPAAKPKREKAPAPRKTEDAP